MRCWYTPIDRHIMDGVHRYKPKNTAYLHMPCQAKGGDEGFRGSSRPAEAWEPLKQVMGTNATPKWFSSGAVNMQVPLVDIAFVKYLLATDRVALGTKAWLSCLVRDLSGAVLRDTTGKQHDGGWLYPLVQVGDAWLVWPCSWCSVDYNNGQVSYLKFHTLDCVHLAFVVEVPDWEVATIQWLSPLSQRQLFRGTPLADVDHPQVRACEIQGQPRESLLRAAARRCFGKLSKTTLSAICDELKIPHESAHPLFKLLFDMVMHVLECDEALSWGKPCMRGVGGVKVSLVS